MTSILSTQSTKAWVAAAVSALLTPVLNMLLGTEVISLRMLLVAVISGLLGFIAVWAAENAPGAAAPQVEPQVTLPTATARPVVQPLPPVSPLQEHATEDFGGQSVTE